MIEFPNEDAKWAWLAGLIEGEGCLSVGRLKSKNGKVLRYQSQMSICNTRKELLEEAQLIAGGRVYSPNFHQKETWSHQHLLVIFPYAQTLNIVSKIAPYLVTKKRQATLITEFLTLKLSGNKVADTPRYAEIYDEMKKLNRRGIVPQAISEAEPALKTRGVKT